LIALALVVLGLVRLSEHAAAVAEFKHSSGKGGPNLKDRRKAMIVQIHSVQTHA
jgi:hypothetical protein